MSWEPLTIRWKTCGKPGNLKENIPKIRKVCKNIENEMLEMLEVSTNYLFSLFPESP